MKTVLFDTNILIDYLKGKPEATSLLDRCLKEGQILTCSLITNVELLSGARQGEEKVLQDFLGAFDRIGLDGNIAEAAGRYMGLYRKSHGINTADAVIAASALVRGAVLYTLSERHFPMNDIQVIKPY
jgi:predicted nucleic acid-binding protein